MSIPSYWRCSNLTLVDRARSGPPKLSKHQYLKGICHAHHGSYITVRPFGAVSAAYPHCHNGRLADGVHCICMARRCHGIGFCALAATPSADSVMRFVGILLLLFLFLAAARLAVVVLALVFLVSLLWGALNRPAQAFSFMAFLVLAKLAEVYPASLLAVLAICAIITCRKKIT